MEVNNIPSNENQPEKDTIAAAAQGSTAQGSTVQAVDETPLDLQTVATNLKGDNVDNKKRKERSFSAERYSRLSKPRCKSPGSNSVSDRIRAVCLRTCCIDHRIRRQITRKNYGPLDLSSSQTRLAAEGPDSTSDTEFPFGSDTSCSGSEGTLAVNRKNQFGPSN